MKRLAPVLFGLLVVAWGEDELHFNAPGGICGGVAVLLRGSAIRPDIIATAGVCPPALYFWTEPAGAVVSAR